MKTTLFIDNTCLFMHKKFCWYTNANKPIVFFLLFENKLYINCQSWHRIKLNFNRMKIQTKNSFLNITSNYIYISFERKKKFSSFVSKFFVWKRSFCLSNLIHVFVVLYKMLFFFHFILKKNWQSITFIVHPLSWTLHLYFKIFFFNYWNFKHQTSISYV